MQVIRQSCPLIPKELNFRKDADSCHLRFSFEIIRRASSHQTPVARKFMSRAILKRPDLAESGCWAESPLFLNLKPSTGVLG